MKHIALFFGLSLVTLPSVIPFAPLQTRQQRRQRRLSNPLFFEDDDSSTPNNNQHHHHEPNNSTSSSSSQQVDASSKFNASSSSAATAISTSISSGGKSILDAVVAVLSKIDDMGLSTKPKAKQASVLYMASTGRGTRFKYLAQTMLFYSLYLTYFCTRGFLVVMPLVWQHSYAKLATAVEYPFVDKGALVLRDVRPGTEILRWRTRLLVGLLATVLGAAYVAMGAVRTAGAGFGQIRRTRSLLDGMAAAIDTQEDNARKLQTFASRPVPQMQSYV